MTVWDTYFTAVVVLLVLYVLARPCLLDCLRLGHDLWLDHKRPKKAGADEPGTGIDASGLARRVSEIKRDHAGGLQQYPSAFKKPLLVERKREEMARMAFFQRPAGPEPHEKEDGLTLILV